MSAAPRWSLAASTLGVVEEDLPTTVGILRRHGADGVELRTADGAFAHTGLPPGGRAALREAFAAAGIDVFATASRVRVAEAGDDDAVVARLLAEIRLAADLGARYVRVFPGAPVAKVPSDRVPPLEEDVSHVDRRAVRRLVRVLDAAVELGVRPVLETHDSHPRGVDVARVLGELDAAAPGHPVGAIWDVLHPWRVGEDLETTADALLAHVVDGRGYVQVKDVASRSDTFPVLQGTGTVPVPRFLGLLDRGGYAGPVSLEWERFWNPEAAPLDAALASAASVVAAHPPGAGGSA